MRLFIAIDLPEKRRAELAALCQGLPDVRWTPPEQLHLTLKFIGDVVAREMETISAALAEVKGESFELKFDRLGLFMQRKVPSIIWMGVRPTAELMKLHNSIEKCLKVNGITFDKRSFKPHITIGRIKRVAWRRLDEYMEANSAVHLEPVMVHDYKLYSSQLRPEGAVHNLEESYELIEPGKAEQREENDEQ